MEHDKLYKLLGKYTDSYIKMEISEEIPKKITIREDLNKCIHIYYDAEEILEKKLCFEQIVRNAREYRRKRREKRREKRIQYGRFLVIM